MDSYVDEMAQAAMDRIRLASYIVDRRWADYEHLLPWFDAVGYLTGRDPDYVREQSRIKYSWPKGLEALWHPTLIEMDGFLQNESSMSPTSRGFVEELSEFMQDMTTMVARPSSAPEYFPEDWRGAALRVTFGTDRYFDEWGIGGVAEHPVRRGMGLGVLF